MSRRSTPATAAKRWPSASLLLVAFAVLVTLLPGIPQWLQYDRIELARGEFWRLVTSHFVHWSGEHLFWDVLALGILGCLCDREGTGTFLMCIAAAAAAISLSLWFTKPEMPTYRGLSGIDSALFALFAVRIGQAAIIDKDWRRLGLIGIVSVGFATKIAYELVTGETLFVDSSASGMTPVPLAHVIGALVGVGFALCESSARHVN